MPYGTWFGGGRGFGFRGYSPPWPYIGRGRGGLPRCWAYGPGVPYSPISPDYGLMHPYQDWAEAPGMPPYGSPMGSDQELALLKNQADMLRQHLDQIDARVKELEGTGRSST